MDGKAPPLREWIGLPPGYIENYQIDKMHVVRHVRTEWQANWKTGVDAFYETYHLPHIHPQTQGVMEDFSQYDAYPNGFQRMIVPICTPSHRMHDRANVNEGLQYMMIEAGMDPAEFKGTAMEVRVAVQQAKRARAQAPRARPLRQVHRRPAHRQLGDRLLPERADRHAPGRRVHHALPAAPDRSGALLLRQHDHGPVRGRSEVLGAGLDGAAEGHRRHRRDPAEHRASFRRRARAPISATC